MMQPSRTRRDTHFLLHADIHTRKKPSPDAKAGGESNKSVVTAPCRAREGVTGKSEMKKKAKKNKQTKRRRRVESVGKPGGEWIKKREREDSCSG